MFQLTFTTHSKAFSDGNKGFQAARLLREVADDVENGREAGIIRDTRGSIVGDWHLKESESASVS